MVNILRCMGLFFELAYECPRHGDFCVPHGGSIPDFLGNFRYQPEFAALVAFG
jgi:hypothetical protein